MVRIQAPATTANLGVGFDCLGCALSLYNTYEIEEIERGYEITGCGAAYANEENLVARAYREAMRRMNLPVRGLRVNIQANIPLARGLGSSAACIAAGVLGASLLHGGRMDEQALLDAATTDACIALLDEAGLRAPVLDSLLRAVERHLVRRAAGAYRVGAVLFSNEYGLLGRTASAAEMLAEWKGKKQ